MKKIFKNKRKLWIALGIGLLMVPTSMFTTSFIVSCSSGKDDGASNGGGGQATPPSPPPVNKTKISVTKNTNPTLDFSRQRYQENFSKERAHELYNEFGIFTLLYDENITKYVNPSYNVNSIDELGSPSILKNNSNISINRVKHTNITFFVKNDFNLLEKYNLVEKDYWIDFSGAYSNNDSFDYSSFLKLESEIKEKGIYAFPDTFAIVVLPNDTTAYLKFGEGNSQLFALRKKSTNDYVSIFDLYNNLFSKDWNDFIDNCGGWLWYGNLIFTYDNIFNYFNVPQEHQDKVRLNFTPISRCDENGNVDGVNKYTGFNVKVEVNLVVKDEYKDQYEIEFNDTPYTKILPLDVQTKEFYVKPTEKDTVKEYYTISHATPPIWAWVDWKQIYYSTKFSSKKNSEENKTIALERLVYKYIMSFSNIIKKYVDENKYWDAIFTSDYPIYTSDTGSTEVTVPGYLQAFEATPLNNAFFNECSTDITELPKNSNLDKNNTSVNSNLPINNNDHGDVDPRNFLENFPGGGTINNGYTDAYTINIFSDVNFDYNGYEKDITYFQNVEKFYKYIWNNGNVNVEKLSNTLNPAPKLNLDLYLINWMPILNANTSYIKCKNSLTFGRINHGAYSDNNYYVNPYYNYSGVCSTSLGQRSWYTEDGWLTVYNHTKIGEYYMNFFPFKTLYFTESEIPFTTDLSGFTGIFKFEKNKFKKALNRVFDNYRLITSKP